MGEPQREMGSSVIDRESERVFANTDYQVMVGPLRVVIIVFGIKFEHLIDVESECPCSSSPHADLHVRMLRLVIPRLVFIKIITRSLRGRRKG